MKVTQQKALVLLEQGVGLQQRLTQRSFGDQAEDNAIIYLGILSMGDWSWPSNWGSGVRSPVLEEGLGSARELGSQQGGIWSWNLRPVKEGR